jgi:hypothetical protein
VYAKEEERTTLDYLFGLFKKMESDIKFVIMSDREIKVLEMYGLHNFMPLATFLKGHNKPFKRMMTAFLIERTIDIFSNTFACRKGLFVISKPFSEDLIYLDDYSKRRLSSWVKQTADLKLEEYAAKHNLYDLEVSAKLSRVNKILYKHPFINTICGTMKSYSSNSLINSRMMDVMKDMCRYKNMRMDLSNYNITQGWLPVDEFGQLSLFVA